MRPDRLPRPFRLGLYAFAVAMVLYITLAPTDVLPPPSGWDDKVEHAATWGMLTLLGIALSPRSVWRIPLFTLGLGAVIEVLQAIMPFNRSGDWRDFVADAGGVALGLGLWVAARRRAAA